jgi:hypothetical protein
VCAEPNKKRMIGDARAQAIRKDCSFPVTPAPRGLTKYFYCAGCGAAAVGVNEAAIFTAAEAAEAAINAVLLTIEPTAESGSAFTYVTTAFIKIDFEAT